MESPDAATIGSSISGLPFDRMARRIPAFFNAAIVAGTSAKASSLR